MNGKDKLIAELIAENEKLRKELHGCYYAEACSQGAENDEANEYAHKRLKT